MIELAWTAYIVVYATIGSAVSAAGYQRGVCIGMEEARSLGVSAPAPANTAPPCRLAPVQADTTEVRQ